MKGSVKKPEQQGLPDMEKACTKCGLVKGRDGFYPGQCRYNLMSTCKECTKAKNNRLRKQALAVLEPDVTEKRCSRCKEIKPAGSYFKSRGRASGLRSECKECERAGVLARKSAKQQAAEPVAEKKCFTCKELKPASAFETDVNKSTGLSGDCKMCKERKAGERDGRNLLCNLCKVRKDEDDFMPRSSSNSALLVCLSCAENLERQVELAKTGAKSKECFVCKNVKPASSYVASKSTVDGLGVVCRDCRRDRDKSESRKRAKAGKAGKM